MSIWFRMSGPSCRRTPGAALDGGSTRVGRHGRRPGPPKGLRLAQAGCAGVCRHQARHCWHSLGATRQATHATGLHLAPPAPWPQTPGSRGVAASCPATSFASAWHWHWPPGGRLPFAAPAAGSYGLPLLEHRMPLAHGHRPVVPIPMLACLATVVWMWWHCLLLLWAEQCAAWRCRRMPAAVLAAPGCHFRHPASPPRGLLGRPRWANSGEGRSYCRGQRHPARAEAKQIVPVLT